MDSSVGERKLIVLYPQGQPRRKMGVWYPGPHALVRRILRASGRADTMLSLYRDIVSQNAPHVVERLCRYFLDVVPTRDGDEPLAAKCVRWGADRWRMARQEGIGERACYREFVRGLLGPVTESLHWYVSVPGATGETVWDPVAGPLEQWCRESQDEPQVTRRDRPWDTVSESDVRTFIATRMLAREDVAIAEGGLRALTKVG